MQVFLFFCYWYLFPNKLYRKRNYYPVYILKISVCISMDFLVFFDLIKSDILTMILVTK